MQVFQSQDEFSDIKPCPILIESPFLLKMPEKFATTFIIRHEIELLISLKTEFQADEEWTFQGSLKDFPLANGMCYLLFGDDLLFGKNFHGVDSFGVLLSDLEHSAKGSPSNEFHELKIGRLEVDFVLYQIWSQQPV